MESLHSVGGAITFIALFQQIYTIVIESILSRSCTKSVTVQEMIKQRVRVKKKHKSAQFDILSPVELFCKLWRRKEKTQRMLSTVGTYSTVRKQTKRKEKHLMETTDA